MGLLEKSHTSYRLAVESSSSGFYDHSAHHSYYAVLQMMIHVLFRHAGETNDSLWVKGREMRTGSHNVIFNLFHLQSGSLPRSFRYQFYELQQRRVQADYFDRPMSESDCRKSLSTSKNLRDVILGEFGEHC